MEQTGRRRVKGIRPGASKSSKRAANDQKKPPPTTTEAAAAVAGSDDVKRKGRRTVKAIRTVAPKSCEPVVFQQAKSPPAAFVVDGSGNVGNHPELKLKETKTKTSHVDVGGKYNTVISVSLSLALL